MRLQSSLRLLGSLALVSLSLAQTKTQEATHSLEERADATDPCLKPYSIKDVENLTPWVYSWPTISALDGQSCCRYCFNTKDCVSAAFFEAETAFSDPHSCVLTINKRKYDYDDVTTSDLCPLGINMQGDIDNVDDNWDGLIPGPCWYPGW